MFSVRVDEPPELTVPAIRGDVTRTRRHARRLIALLVAAALFLGGVFGVRWWTHPDLLTNNAGGSVGFGPRPLANSQATFGVTFPERRVRGTSVTFRSAPVVDFAENTAHATVIVSICRSRPKVAGSGGIGAVNGTGRHYCGSIDPISDGTDFTFPGADSIIATVTPTTPGRVVISGMNFNYAMDRAGWYRRGHDHLGMRIVMQRIR